MLNNWEKKEKPIQGMMGFGGGATGYLAGSAGGGGFSGTGGTNTVDTGGYRYHFFRHGGPNTFSVDGGYSGDTTCLLYTSPSPRDRQKSRMPSSA